MKIDPKLKPELCCSRDRFRPALASPTIVGKRLIGTDGRRMVSIPVELDPEDVAGLVNIKALAAARAATPRKRQKGNPSATISIIASDKELKFSADFGPVVVPRDLTVKALGDSNFSAITPKDFGAHKIALNIELLYGVAKALGAETIVIGFDEETSPIRIIPTTGKWANYTDGAFGILMPVRLT